MVSAEKIYKERIQSFTNDFLSVKKRLFVLSVLRFLSFILILLSLFYFIRISVAGGIVSSLIFLIFFLYLVKRYSIFSQKKEYLNKLIKINENEILTLLHVYSQFDNGAVYMNQDHPFTYDIDIFGQGSIFQYLNRTCSYHGKKELAEWLSNVITNKDLIIEKQKTVKELTPDIDLRQNFQATGQMEDENESDFKEITTWLSQPDVLQKKIYRFFSVFFPVLSVFTILLTIIDSDNISFLVLVFLLQLMVVGMQLKNTNKLQAVLGRRFDLIKKLYKLLVFIEKNNFQSPNLKSLQTRLKTENESAHKAVDNLASLVASFDYRLNLITGIFLNGFLVWDIQCVLRIEKWKNRHKKFISDWFAVLGEFDAYCSIANFSFNNPEFTFPKPDENTILEFTNTGHPLIPSSERVNNDLEIKKKAEFIIVTGANMAGKSTFLRTVGLNLILASTGAPVCAEKFVFKPSFLFTSMRTSDSLTKNESYFYAELKRLKELIELLRSGKELFIILDEILKGTNSIDKQKGSKAVLEQIIRLNGSGLIATHDLELANLENEYPLNIKNKCFEIEINGSEIFFDYKLYNGITKKMNASLLMQQMGILEN